MIGKDEPCVSTNTCVKKHLLRVVTASGYRYSCTHQLKIISNIVPASTCAFKSLESESLLFLFHIKKCAKTNNVDELVHLFG